MASDLGGWEACVCEGFAGALCVGFVRDDDLGRNEDVKVAILRDRMLGGKRNRIGSVLLVGKV